MALGLIIGFGSAGCGARHLVLVEVPTVVDLGEVTIAPSSAPVLTGDERSVIYLESDTSALHMMRRDLGNLQDQPLFDLPLGSSLWTLNARRGTLLCSAPDGSGALHIVEYRMDGAIDRSFDVAPGNQDFNGCISPDGNTLAFIRRNNTSGVRRLHTRPVSSSNSAVTARVPLATGQVVFAVNWIDDFHILVSGQEGTGTVLNVLQDLITDLAPPIAELGFYATPDTSGKHVASIIGASSAADLYLSGLNGQLQTQLTNSSNIKLAISWRADGRAVVYTTRHGSPSQTTLEMVKIPDLK